jgi:plasmid stabilization system protein ParE
MNLAIERASYFTADFERQFAWYVDQAGAQIAWRFQAALNSSLVKLSNQPDLGRLRHFRHPKLHDLRSYRVEPPFDNLLIFYRFTGEFLQAVRLMHGARDLPGRLIEPPGSSIK